MMSVSSFSTLVKYSCDWRSRADVPIHVFQQCGSSSQREMIKYAVLPKLTALFEFLDRHLQDRTFLVGERVSLADISLYVSLSEVLRLNIHSFEESSSLMRWFYTVGNNRSVCCICSLPEL
jgi:glutathione S-transferase